MHAIPDPTQFFLRVASINDTPAVSALLEASYPTLLRADYSAEILGAALPLLTRANPSLLASGTFYVAQAESRIVGCGGWSFERPGSGEIVAGLGHVRHFATHPDWTRIDVGRALLSRCIEEATIGGLDILHCQSTLSAQEFYRKQGFVAIETTGVELAPNVVLAAVLMTLRLR
jgi:N-acetylglutamate synthase-like GNAT family acetyltransferase